MAGSKLKPPTPRLFLLRHGQTLWSEAGKRTSYTDLDLTSAGADLVRGTVARLVDGLPHHAPQAGSTAEAGAGANGASERKIVLQARRVRTIVVSPRLRARHTARLLTGDPVFSDGVDYPDTQKQTRQERLTLGDVEHDYVSTTLPSAHCGTARESAGAGEDAGWRGASVRITESVREMEYGEFEGWKTGDIKSHTGNGAWETWQDDAPGGESIAEVTKRVDGVIDYVRSVHRQVQQEANAIVAGGANDAAEQLAALRTDVVIVSHGHFLRAFGARWIGTDVSFARALQIDAGGLCVLSYEHNSLDEPAIQRWNVV